MSYTPTEWKTGDVITADKLNNMENGIVNAGLFVINATGVADSTYTSTQPTLDKTIAEVSAAYQAGKRIVVEWIHGGGPDSDTIKRAELCSYSKFKETGELESVTFSWTHSPIANEVQFISITLSTWGSDSCYTVLTK